MNQKNSYEEKPFKRHFNINVKRIKVWNTQKNDYDKKLWKYGPFQAIQKSIFFY
jgi:hypothetical protein